jgi:hypothetical protein
MGIYAKTSGTGWNLGGLYGGEAQFDKLRAIYAVDPVHAVRPIGLIRSEPDARVEGHLTERVNGGTVRQHASAHPEHITKMQEQIGKFHETLERAGQYHGDAHAGNALSTEEGDVKFIDPSIIPYTPDEGRSIAFIQITLEGLRSL